MYSFKPRSPNWSLPFRLIPNVVCLSYPHHASWRWDSITLIFRCGLQLRHCVLCNSSNFPLQHTRLHLASNIVLSSLVSNVHNLCSSRIVKTLFSYSCHFSRLQTQYNWSCRSQSPRIWRPVDRRTVSNVSKVLASPISRPAQKTFLGFIKLEAIIPSETSIST